MATSRPTPDRSAAPGRPAELPGPARSAAALTVGTALNGLLAYGFFALVTRGLGSEAAAPVAVLWTYWGACTAFITFPLQHWVIRTIQADGPAATGDGLRRLVPWVVGVAAVATAGAWAAAEPLFQTGGLVWPSLVGVVTLGTFLTGAVRGGLAGRGRFTATAVALVADNGVRVLGAAVVLAADGGTVAVGVVLAVGAVIELAWPSALRYPRLMDRGTSPLRLVGPVATGSALAQLVLVGGPVAVPFVGGTPDEVTVLFVTLALFRAPYLLGLGVANQLTGPLTRWRVEHATHKLRRFHLFTALATGSGALLSIPVGIWAGPPLIALVFGAETRPSATLAALVAIGSSVAVGNLALTLAVIGEGRGVRLTRTWAVAGLVAVVAMVASPTAPMLAVATGFVAGQVAAFSVLLVTGWRGIDAGDVQHDDTEVAA